MDPKVLRLPLGGDVKITILVIFGEHKKTRVYMYILIKLPLVMSGQADMGI